MATTSTTQASPASVKAIKDQATSNPARAASASAKPIKAQAAPKPPAKAPTIKTPVNVYALLMNGGPYDWTVHSTTCKSYKAAKAKSAYAGLDDYEISDVLNQRDVIMDVWDDQIRESFTDADGDDYAAASWGWLKKNGYVDSVSFHSVCLQGLPQTSKAAAASKSSEAIKKATKNELATRVAEAAAKLLDDIFDENDGPESKFLAALLAAFGSEDQARQCVAQWMHGMPVDRDRWYASGLPIPQRSDWADYTPPATPADVPVRTATAPAEAK